MPSTTLEITPTTSQWNPAKPACSQGEEYEGCRTVNDLANTAEEALRTHTDAKVETELEQYHASDMLANIFHLADKKGWDIDEIIDSARARYEEEK